MIKLSRRKLIVGGIGLAGFGLAALPSRQLLRDQWGSICSLPKSVPPGAATGYDTEVSRFVPRVIFFKESQMWSIDLPLQGHVVQQNPYRPEQLIILNRRGPSGVELHFGQRKIKSVFTAEEGRVFLGHCTFLPGGDTYALAEFRRADRKNFLVHRRSHDHKLVREYPIEQMLPHQLLVDADAKHIWVPSLGSTEGSDLRSPHVAVRSIETNQIQDSVLFPQSGTVGPKHLIKVDGLGLIALGGGTESHSFVARIWRDSEGLKSVGGHQALPGEALSLVCGSDLIVYASFPSADRVVAYEGESMKVLRELKVLSPMGLQRMNHGDIWVASEGTVNNISVIRGLELIAGAHLGLRADERFGAHFELLEGV